jgi:RNA polymerase sigma factor (sigma-70 family)
VSVQSPHSTSPDEVPLPADAGDQASFDAMFRAHADHVFEYCHGLLGDTDEAAAATQATFITAYSLVRYLRDPRRLEPWLFALARRECTSKDPGRAELQKHAGSLLAAADQESAAPGSGAIGARGSVADADTDQLAAISDAVADELAAAQALAAFNALPEGDREVLEAFSTLRPRDREVIDLVYWRGIHPTELPSILGISQRRGEALLVAAEERFRRSADRTQSTGIELGEDTPPQLEADLLTVLPTARLPAGVWRRTVSLVFDRRYRPYRRAVAAHAGPLDAEGFPEQPAPPGTRARRLMVASAVVAPAAAGLLAIAYLAGTSSPSPGSPHNLALTSPAASPTTGSPTAAAAARTKAPHHKAVLPVTALFPAQPTQGQPTGAPGPLPSPHPSPSSITGVPPTPSPKPTKSSPSPSPSPTSPSPTSPSPTSTSPSPSPTSPSPTA